MHVVNFSLRLYRFIKRHVNSFILFIKHSLNSTFSNLGSELVSMPFDFSLLTNPPHEVINLYHQHFFDILGSGWTQVKHKKKYSGFEGNNYSNKLEQKFSFFNKTENKINHSNRDHSEKLNKKLDKNYIPIDWQVDIKSGYRWSESTHYKFIRFGNFAGVDIKLPWELARMHHLVHLASDYSKNPKLNKKNKIEFQNQVIDFIANNPPCFGVNWVCTMDVAIRISNILLAYDIFKSSKCDFSNDFNTIIANSTYDHGKHIINNLEWYDGNRGNHYFSNIIGLLFCSSHLKITETSHAWFIFGVSELINEIDFQFHSDGSNFEGSTLYHRLVTEFAIWGTVLVLDNVNVFLRKYPNNKILKNIYKKNKRTENFSIFKNNSFVFLKRYFDKLKKTLCFLEDIMLYDGSIPQIGDNDSGRLFKLNPAYTKSNLIDFKKSYINLKYYDDLNDNIFYFLENHLQVDSFLKTSNSLLYQSLCRICNKNNLKILNKEYIHIKSLFKTKSCKKFDTIKSNTNIKILSEQKIRKYLEGINSIKTKKVITNYFSLTEVDYKAKLEIIKYESFGVYIYKSKNLYLLIRSKNHKVFPFSSGHYHQDQLSLELHVNRAPVIIDPGTYVYTSSPKKRNLYRSENAHFSPLINNEQYNTTNIFKLNEIYSSNVSHFSEYGFHGSVEFQNNLYERIILLKSNVIEVIDIVPNNSINKVQVKLPVSPGYGILKNI